LDILRTARDTARPGRYAVLALAIAILLSAWRDVATAQPAGTDLISVRSHSGQFIVYAGRAIATPPPATGLTTNQDFVRLEPTLVTVSCERIKQALMRELGVAAPWRGTVYVVLYPARTPGEPITISSERFNNGWQYRIEFPDVMERSRYVRVIVQVLLIEMANRTVPPRSAEIPLWLVEGLAQLLVSSSEVDLILAPPRAKANGLSFSATTVNSRLQTLRQQAQKQLHGRPPLTFENLSWPSEDPTSGDVSDLYRGSAQLFVGELLRLPDGRGCLQAMLTQLPQHYNWQFAFLSAFDAYFARPLDVEKWWALSVAQATGRDIAPTWTREESWQKLTQATHSAVQVRFGTNELPLHAEITLQTVIREWDSVRQTQALYTTMREFGLLRLHIDQDFVVLVQDYYQALEGYLLQRDHAGSFLSTKNAARRRAVEVAIQQLDALDARREALRPAARPIPPNQSPALSTTAP
jgi:hypothetical protein